MKKIGAVIILLVVAAVVVLMTVDFNRFGKDNVYVEVAEPTEVEEDRLDNGEIMERYRYQQTAFDEQGEAVEVEFTAGKELRRGAYLMLYVKNENEVTSYDEVEWEEITADAQTELEEAR
ncbi:YxeA family protein [Gracilibacillus phocaeensis]|uniref:YxeA family protein n=1 Tax=Gracilibacillus phocaeensis TaxID=2042304 RepID=UPI00102FE217|nr:YxeA family protein [Gracilibacillus phocaeensis]